MPERQEHLTLNRLESNVVRVSVPAAVAYNFDKFSKIQKDILGKLGCMACTSGWDIRWQLERNFLVDEKLNIQVVGPDIAGP